MNVSQCDRDPSTERFKSMNAEKQNYVLRGRITANLSKSSDNMDCCLLYPALRIFPTMLRTIAVSHEGRLERRSSVSCEASLVLFSNHFSAFLLLGKAIVRSHVVEPTLTLYAYGFLLLQPCTITVPSEALTWTSNIYLGSISHCPPLSITRAAFKLVEPAGREKYQWFSFSEFG